MKDLGHIPFEIWQLIFQYACIDGGNTGCALALVSKSFHHLSAATRFHSLTLSSLFQVKVFLVCLERIRRSGLTRTIANADESPVPIYNLHLSFLSRTCDAPQRTVRKWTNYARTERALILQVENDHKSWATSKELWNAECVLHVSRLLQLASPTLRSLVVLQCLEIRVPLVRYRLPALRELTLLGDDRMFLRIQGPGVSVPGQNDPSDLNFASIPAEPPDDPPFPALTHMHVVFNGPKLHPWEKTLPHWAAIAPSLTHLRISQGHARTPAVVADMLGAELPIATPDEDVDVDAGGLSGIEPPPVPHPTYPSLRVVIVQLCGEHKTNTGEDPASRELEQIREELLLRDDPDGETARLTILRSRAYMPGYWEARLLWDWGERMTGGEGCWSEVEADEDVWKFSRLEALPTKRRHRKGSIDVKDILRESSSDSGEAVSEQSANPRRWWKFLANSVQRVKGRNAS